VRYVKEEEQKGSSGKRNESFKLDITRTESFSTNIGLWNTKRKERKMELRMFCIELPFLEFELCRKEQHANLSRKKSVNNES
jgi:hypothetical protein